MRADVIGTRGFPSVQGGVERHSQSLYPRMSADVSLRVFRRRPFLSDASRAASYPRIEFRDLPSTRIAGLEAMLHSLFAACCSIARRPDVVHVHNIGPGLVIPLLKLFGLKVVMTYHSPNYEHAKWGRLARRILRIGESLSLRFADAIIFVSSAQMARYDSRVRSKSVLIPNGVEPPLTTDATDILDRFGLRGKRFLLAVGRLTPEKGFHHLVEAVQKADNVATLVIAGGADNDDSYARRLSELDTHGKTVFTGALDSDALAQLYAAADSFVLSSVNEGFPLVMLEAMSYQLPVFASDIPATAIPQIPAADKFPAADSEALADFLRRRFPAVEKRAYDLSGYDWKNIARQTEDIYRNLLRRD